MRALIQKLSFYENLPSKASGQILVYTNWYRISYNSLRRKSLIPSEIFSFFSR